MNTYRFEIQNVVFCLSVDATTEEEARERLRQALERTGDGIAVDLEPHDGAIYVLNHAHAARVAQDAIVLDIEEDEETDQ